MTKTWKRPQGVKPWMLRYGPWIGLPRGWKWRPYRTLRERVWERTR